MFKPIVHARHISPEATACAHEPQLSGAASSQHGLGKVRYLPCLTPAPGTVQYALVPDLSFVLPYTCAHLSLISPWPLTPCIRSNGVFRAPWPPAPVCLTALCPADLCVRSFSASSRSPRLPLSKSPSPACDRGMERTNHAPKMPPAPGAYNLEVFFILLLSSVIK